jgi:hypothetical protein
MALTHDYTIICELARPEAGGKFIIIGLFPNGIGAPHIPFPLPVLTFFSAMKSDSAAAYKFTGKLSQLATGEMVAMAQGMIQTAAAGPVILPISIGNPQFKAFGTYTWALEIDGQDEPFVTEFNLAHVPMPQMRMPPGFPGGFQGGKSRF